ncbi:unnamed protein product [Lymnaea stagnalis]|uniref:F-box domain-containing protein n=1 Tax=Lymnaea stagnalis TaxID=6523 RepID=A0AAV2IK98_LYMST
MEKVEQDEVGEPAGFTSCVDRELVAHPLIQEGAACVLADAHKSLTFSNMPEEILEHILSFLSPYRDMDAAKLVSKQWNRIIKSVVSQRKRRFYQSVANCEVSWTLLTKEITGQGNPERGYLSISDRHSHSAAYHDGSMYIFGGCTSTNTTFNDLWRFDLTTRQWIRPVAMGTYPSPKACATMVVYNGTLVLFGGWSHPIPYPNPHQSAHYFSELHVYSPSTNRWSHILSLGQEPEALGGHSASVVGHLMVVFGGSPRTGLGTNNVWVFNFQKCTWKLQPVARDPKPEPRYGQYQTTLDESHILIMGGSVGGSRVYNDMWLLTLHPTDPWFWTRINVEHPELAATQSWCHAACRVNDVIVVVAKSNKPRQARNIRTRAARAGPPKATASNCYGCGSENTLPASNNVAQPNSPVSPQEARPQRQEDLSPLKDLQHICEDESCNRNVKNGDLHDDDDQKGHNSPNKNLLALQQRLHRECANLPDPDNHHHNPHGFNKDEPEGHFNRLSSRYGPEAPTGAGHSPFRDQPQQVDQPQNGSFQRANVPACIRGRGGGVMPSVRPNAMCNRQKQLEALLRQEEILRSKSRALAAARSKQPVEASNCPVVDETVPDIITTKNRMDAHALNISRVLSDGVAEWRPLSELQPSCAPTETICCSMLEGRGELVLFGGVIRDMKSPVGTNTAINKLYILQPR